MNAVTDGPVSLCPADRDADEELAGMLSRLSRQLTRLAVAVDNLEADLAERTAAASSGPPGSEPLPADPRVPPQRR